MSTGSEKKFHAWELGHLNYKHGICGFVAAITAYYKCNKEKIPEESLESFFSHAKDKDWMEGEILSFLNEIDKDTKNKIGCFMKEFPDTDKKWTLADYMSSKKKEYLDLALLPEHVQLFLLKKYSIASKILDENAIHSRPDEIANSIVGITSNKNPQKSHKGLEHYIYVTKSFRVYSWGEKYDNLNTFQEQNGLCECLFLIKPI